MTKEEKDLVLCDICGRLPYGVKFATKYGHFNDTHELLVINKHSTIVETFKMLWWDIEDVKPYLRPLSSMTEGEKNELKEYLDAEEVDFNGFGYSEGGTLEDYISSIPYSICSSVVDWLNKKMFDFRGLIPNGLALEAKEGMYNN